MVRSMLPRRRTTDQVYATLQHVQRRISEQGHGPAPVSAPTPAPAIRLPPRDPGDPPTGAVPRPQPPQDLPPNLDQRATVTMSVQVAATIGLVWCCTLALTFWLGRSSAPDATPAGDSEVELPAPTPTPVIAAQTGPRHILVLKSVNGATPTQRAEWQATADRLNNISTRHASKGYKPLFAIRETNAGQLQLLFGRNPDGRLGVTKGEYEEFAALLMAPANKGGGAYSSAAWVPVE